MRWDSERIDSIYISSGRTLTPGRGLGGGLLKLRNSIPYLIFAIMSFLFLPIHAGYAESMPTFLITTEDWEPYNFMRDGIVQGISTDIFVLMLEKTGSSQGRKDIEIYPWIRAYKMTLERPNTVLYTTARTDERENLFKWVGPIFETHFTLYALKSRHIKINALNDLKKYKIGTVRGDAYEDLLTEKTGMTVRDFYRVALNIQNTKKLMNGRIDLAAQSMDTTVHTSREAGLDPELFEPVFLLETIGMYYAFNKDTQDFVISRMQNAFDDLKNEGKLTEIFQKYGK